MTEAISIVIPCLNEEESLSECLTIAKKELGAFGPSSEVIVADNGSTDTSIEIAKSMDVNVLEVEKRGYGAALDAGIRAARNDLVVFADADCSYNFNQLSSLVDTLKNCNSDMVIGSRINSSMETGAMPVFNRYLGTPVLTQLINIFFGARLTDVNSGFRVFRKKAYLDSEIHSQGMEFASEMIIKFIKNGFKIAECPIKFCRDSRGVGSSKLRPWRDGMRHLRVILALYFAR